MGISGQEGQQCDEVDIKHMGQNIYNIYYRIKEAGDYCVVIKYGEKIFWNNWIKGELFILFSGEDHVPGSPVNLRA